MVPLAFNSPVGAPPTPSTSLPPYEEITSATMASRPASPSIPPASELKRSASALSSNPSSRSKRQKLDSAGNVNGSLLRCASYALEMMSRGLRTHVIGALVIGCTIRLLYYDRSIFLQSEALDFLEAPSLFVEMLRGLANLSLSQFGYPSAITPPPPPLLGGQRRADISHSLELTLSDSDGTVLQFSSVIYLQYGIIGHGTCVLRANITGSKTGRHDYDRWVGPLIVKLSWPVKSRDSEIDLIVKARNAADHDEHRWVLKHLPNVRHAEDQPIETLPPALIEHLGEAYEERVLRIIVQDELYSITERTNAVDLVQSFREIFKCRRLHSV